MIVRQRRGRIAKLPEITLTPLIDTALVLLVIFMVTTPVMYNSIKVDLPQGALKESDFASDQLIVSIDKNDQIYVAGKPVSFVELVPTLQRIPAVEKKAVVVAADKGSSSDILIRAVDTMKYLAGVESVILSTQG